MFIESWNFCDYVLLDLRGKITSCKEKLETESSGNAIATIQGKLEGFKILRDLIIEEFGEGTPNVLREAGCPLLEDMSSMALSHFDVDINTHEDNWARIDRLIDMKHEELKKYLYEDATNARALHVSHGARDAINLASNLSEKIEGLLEAARDREPLFNSLKENVIEYAEEDLKKIDEKAAQEESDETDAGEEV